MKAPDKIYVSRNFSEDNSPHGLWYLNKSEHDINVEYIRKDALLDKLNFAIKLRTQGDSDANSDGIQTLKAIINYINAL